MSAADPRHDGACAVAETPLDRPILSSLSADHRRFAEGGPLAWRYVPEVAPFATPADGSPEALAALTALVPASGRIMVLTPEILTPPAGLEVIQQAPLLQMILEAPAVAPVARTGHADLAPVELGAADVAEMMDLTARTRPGPFGPRTWELGRYIGLRAEERLVAMAGERMRFGRHVEISAVCVDPEHRGRGHAAGLMMRLAQQIQKDGGTPFLHVLADNRGAIDLYRRLGFADRKSFHVTVLRPASDGD